VGWPSAKKFRFKNGKEGLTNKPKKGREETPVKKKVKEGGSKLSSVQQHHLSYSRQVWVRGKKIKRNAVGSRGSNKVETGWISGTKREGESGGADGNRRRKKLTDVGSLKKSTITNASRMSGREASNPVRPANRTHLRTGEAVGLDRGEVEREVRQKKTVGCRRQNEEGSRCRKMRPPSSSLTKKKWFWSTDKEVRILVETSLKTGGRDVCLRA